MEMGCIKKPPILSELIIIKTEGNIILGTSNRGPGGFLAAGDGGDRGRVGGVGVCGDGVGVGGGVMVGIGKGKGGFGNGKLGKGKLNGGLPAWTSRLSENESPSRKENMRNFVGAIFLGLIL
ncbi:hypothetical protein L2E82_28345 [Cichorium intybus]|uniref:Uncharacterized protein n=1 Tax=Cichorium intybus TaxID=13427 RepID=A0ACB9CVY0_CICIN|nr:hypothetical protein L2E82_28345 [Cichorium intybus]